LAAARNASARTTPGPARLDLLLKNNPVLTVSALQSPETVAELVAAWNPAVADELRAAASRRARMPRARGARIETVDYRVASAAAEGMESLENAEPEMPPVHLVGDGIRWHGPIRLTPMLRADAGLPAAASGTGATATSRSSGSGSGSALRDAVANRPSGGFAYVAEVERSRVKVPDSRRAAELRRRYPQGIPTGAEAEAWSLVRGLAKRLRGVAHLPGSPAYVPHADLEPLVSEHDYRVYSHEMLPWVVLREILRPLAPELSREPLPGEGGYILRQRGLLEVRVRPAGISTTTAGTPPEGRSTPIPYAIRDRADEAWPHSVYEFCDLSRSDLVAPVPAPHHPVLRSPRAVRVAAVGAPDALRNAATLIAEVTGGVLLDTDGFPVAIRALAPQ
jgi:hypothetical protein